MGEDWKARAIKALTGFESLADQYGGVNIMDETDARRIVDHIAKHAPSPSPVPTDDGLEMAVALYTRFLGTPTDNRNKFILAMAAAIREGERPKTFRPSKYVLDGPLALKGNSLPAPATQGEFVDVTGLSADAIADIEAHVRGKREGSETYSYTLGEGWRCFHCGELFHTWGGARLHFGETPSSVTKCLVGWTEDNYCAGVPTGDVRHVGATKLPSSSTPAPAVEDGVREALKPFAEKFDQYVKDQDGEPLGEGADYLGVTVRLGDCRRARAVLQSTTPPAVPSGQVGQGDFVTYCEPGAHDFPQWITIRAEHAAEIYKRAFPERNYTNEQALEDFIAVNWATRTSTPPTETKP